MKLYQITNEYQSVLSRLFDPETGEIDNNALEVLNIIDKRFEDKGIDVVHHLRNIESDIECVDREIERLSRIKKRINSESEWLREYLKSNMLEKGITEISCPYFKIMIRDCPESVDVPCEAQIPQKYFIEKTTYKLDKIAIKKDIKAGIEVEGASLKRNKSLVIK